MTDSSIDYESQLFEGGGGEEERTFEQSKVRTRDLWIYGINSALTVGEVGKTTAEWATYDGGSDNTFLDQVGELMAVGVASRALWVTTKSTESYVLSWPALMLSAVSVVTVFESMAGFGAPDQGSGFSTGERKHKALERTLFGLDPDTGQWSGDAANIYATRNGVLKDLAETMAGLDAQMAALVKVQAEQANTVRQGLSGTKLALYAAFPVIAYMASAAAVAMVGSPVPGAWEAAVKKLGYAIMGVGGAAFGAVVGLGITGLIQGAQNASAAADIAKSYGDVVSKAAPASSPAPSPVSPVAPAPAPSSPVSPAPSPVSPAAPAPAPSPGSPSSPVSPRRPAVSPAAPAAAASSDPAPAAASPTTLESLASAMGLAMQAEPGMAQAASQGMQSVQQFAQMAAQAGKHKDPAPAAGPAPAGQDPANDASGDPDRAAGATGGVAGAGRAPVDSAAPAATGTAEQSERSL